MCHKQKSQSNLADLGDLDIGLTQALRKLGVLGFLAVTQIKLSDNFCVSPEIKT
jgi:hypothetical protein